MVDLLPNPCDIVTLPRLKTSETLGEKGGIRFPRALGLVDHRLQCRRDLAVGLQGPWPLRQGDVMDTDGELP